MQLPLAVGGAGPAGGGSLISVGGDGNLAGGGSPASGGPAGGGGGPVLNMGHLVTQSYMTNASFPCFSQPVGCDYK